MSSILEALEKAEEERIRGVLPGRRPTQRRSGERQPRTSWVVLGVVLLLALNLLILWRYLSSRPAPQVPQQPPVRVEAEAPREPPAVQKPQPAPPAERPPLSLREQLNRNTTPSSKPLFEEAKVAPKPPPPPPVKSVAEPAQSRIAPRVQPPQQALEPTRSRPGNLAETAPVEPARPESSAHRDAPVPAPKPAVVETPPPPEAPPEVEAPAVPQEQIPLVWELPQVLRERVLQLKSSIHVYSQQPSQRFVIINMRRYGEGDSLPPSGFLLHRIDRDGVVIDYGDGLVRLPRR